MVKKKWKTDVPKAVIYARTSRDEPGENQKPSCEVQIDHCKRYAERENISVLGIFEDADRSGRMYEATSEGERLQNEDTFLKEYFGWRLAKNLKKRREALAAMFKLLPNVDYIIVDEVTRFGRNVNRSNLSNHLHSVLKENHVALVDVEKNQIVHANELINQIQEIITDDQIQMQRRKATESKRKIKDAGRLDTARPPWGYRVDKNTHTVYIDSQAMPIVKEVFKLFGQEKSKGEICRRVNEKYKSYFEGRKDKKLFKKLIAMSLAHTIRNPRYCGKSHKLKTDYVGDRTVPAVAFCNEEELKKYYDFCDDPLYKNISILKPSQWRDLQSRFKHHEGRQRGSVIHPLSGLIYCGCGYAMGLSINKIHAYYRCQQRHSGACVIDTPPIRMDSLEQAVKPLLSKKILEDIVEAERGIDFSSRKKEIEFNLSELEEKRKSASEKYKNNELSLSMLMIVDKDIEAMAVKLKTELSDIDAKSPRETTTAVRRWREFINRHDKLSDIDFKKMARDTIEKIIVEKEIVKIKFNDRKELILNRQGNKLPRASVTLTSKSATIRYVYNEQFDADIDGELLMSSSGLHVFSID